MTRWKRRRSFMVHLVQVVLTRTNRRGERRRTKRSQQRLGGFDQVVDVDVEVVVVFDVVDGGLGWDLVDDQACPLLPLLRHVLHLLPHQALRLLPGGLVCWEQVFVFWTKLQRRKKKKTFEFFYHCSLLKMFLFVFFNFIQLGAKSISLSGINHSTNQLTNKNESINQ